MKPNRSAWRIVGFLLIASMALSLVGAGVGVSMYNSENPRKAWTPYNPGRTNYNQFGPGGAGGLPVDSNPADFATSRDVRNFLTSFGRALKLKDSAPEPWIDTEAVLAHARRTAPPGLVYAPSDGPPGPNDLEAKALTHELKVARTTWRTWNWDELVVHRVNRLAPDSFEAITSFAKPDGSRVKILWALSYSPLNRSYAITRWTDLATGLDSDGTIALGLVSYSNIGGLDRLLLNLRALPEAHRSMDERKYEDARKHLDRAARAQNPRWGRGIYELAEARFDTLFYNVHAQAVDRLDDLLADRPGHLSALMLQMEALAKQSNYDEIADLAQQYQARTGPDADALAWAGSARAGLEQKDEARRLFEQARALDPYQITAIEGLLKLTPDDEKPEFIRLVTELKYFRGLFHRLAESQSWFGDWTSLESLSRAHRKRFPEDHSATRHLVRALLMRGEFAESTKAFGDSIAQLKGEPRAALLTDFLESSSQKSRAAEAYDAVPMADRPEAFRKAMESWDYRLSGDDFDDEFPEDTEELRPAILAKYKKLVAEHGKAHPDDNWLSLYKAKQQNRDGERAAAEMSAAAFLERVKPSGDHLKDFNSGYEPARREWLMAKLHLGQTAAAYERFADDTALSDLGHECIRCGNSVELGKLIATREKREPAFLDRHYWHGEHFWIQKSYARCAEEMLSYLTQEAPEANVYSAYRYTARDRLIRSWVKAKNPDAALEYLKKEEEDPPLLHALALAGGNSSEEAEVYLLEAMTEKAWLAAMAYRDPDLGPILLGPGYKRLQAKFPPPPPIKKKPAG